jgi:hypothetical protein
MDVSHHYSRSHKLPRGWYLANVDMEPIVGYIWNIYRPWSLFSYVVVCLYVGASHDIL